MQKKLWVICRTYLACWLFVLFVWLFFFLLSFMVTWPKLIEKWGSSVMFQKCWSSCVWFPVVFCVVTVCVCVNPIGLKWCHSTGVLPKAHQEKGSCPLRVWHGLVPQRGGTPDNQERTYQTRARKFAPEEVSYTTLFINWNGQFFLHSRLFRQHGGNW
jgi:hypothetical protein